MELQHWHTVALSALLAAATKGHNRPFTSYWLAALGVAQQYKLVYGTTPHRLSSMLRQIGAAIAAASTLVFCRYPKIAEGMAKKFNCTLPQFWAAHFIYHVCPVLAVWHHKSQKPWPRAFGALVHILWATHTDVNAAYTNTTQSTLVEGMAVAMLMHALV